MIESAGPIVLVVSAASALVWWVHVFVQGCPGRRCMTQVHELAEAFAELLSASEAREKRMAELSRRIASERGQIERASRARAKRTAESHQDEGDSQNGQPQASAADVELANAMLHAARSLRPLETS
jgi:hypothetical protein